MAGQGHAVIALIKCWCNTWENVFASAANSKYAVFEWCRPGAQECGVHHATVLAHARVPSGCERGPHL